MLQLALLNIRYFQKFEFLSTPTKKTSLILFKINDVFCENYVQSRG
jgi:hypothetical protein